MSVFDLVESGQTLHAT